MGQAKQRGSFEKRQALAIERSTAEKAQRLAEIEAIEANMTPEERHSKKRSQQKLAMLLSFAGMPGVPSI